MADEFGDDGVQTFDASTGQYALSETVHGSESDLLMHQLNEFMEAEKEKIIDAFREFDVDSNGALDFGEMCAMANSLRITVPIAHLRYLFDKIDEHRSGMVDILELEHYVRRWRRRIGSHRRDDTGGGTSPTAKPGKWFKERVGPNAGDVAFSWHINPAAAKEQREQQEQQERQKRQQQRQQQQERPETGDTDGGLGGSGAKTRASSGASGGRGKPGEMRGSASHGALRGSAKGNRGALGRSSTSALSPLSASLSASSSVLPGDSGSKGVRGRIGEAREMDRSVSNGRKEERKEGRKASAASNASKGAGGNTGGNTGGKTGGRKASSMATTTAANAATTTFGNNDGDGDSDSDSDSSGYDDSDSMDEVDAEEAAAAAAAAAKAKTLEEELGAENAVRATELQSYRATELKGSTLVYIFSVAWRDLHVYYNTEKCEVFHL